VQGDLPFVESYLNLFLIDHSLLDISHSSFTIVVIYHYLINMFGDVVRYRQAKWPEST